jgi:hypothetical protein
MPVCFIKLRYQTKSWSCNLCIRRARQIAYPLYNQTVSLSTAIHSRYPATPFRAHTKQHQSVSARIESKICLSHRQPHAMHSEIVIVSTAVNGMGKIV